MINGALSVCLILLGGITWAYADELSDEIQALGKEGRPQILDQTGKRFSVDSTSLPSLADPASRNAAAADIALRRALSDVADGRWAATVPGAQQKASTLVVQPNPTEGLADDALLAHAVAQRIALPNFREMVGAEGEVESDGNVQRIPAHPENPFIPVSQSGLAHEPTVNRLPDIYHLAFSMSFLVEMHMSLSGYSWRCSGALIEPRLILTARHCVVYQGHQLDGTNIVARSASGGPILHAARIWTLEVDAGDPPDDDKYRDVALISLTDSLQQNITYAHIAPATNQYLWVIMAGFGYTDFAAPNSSWTTGYLAPQVVNFGDYHNSPLHALAAIPWDNSITRGSQCAGDSGGPVLIEGKNSEPLIVGVLSRAAVGDPASIDACAASQNATFINLGHSYDNKPLCDQLLKYGTTCVSPPDFISRPNSG
jgi:hypothetical protein